MEAYFAYQAQRTVDTGTDFTVDPATAVEENKSAPEASILDKYVIDDSTDEIFLKKGDDFIKEKSINQELPENIKLDIIKKLNIFPPQLCECQ